ncbi:MAG: penicillin-binding transpeptidase domain-containing protein [Gammaproteobacteria bacterium]
MREKVHTPVSAFRLVVISSLLLSSALVLVWRAFDLQVLRKDFLQGQGDARALRTEPVAAHRGMITDRNGEPLAISTPVDSVWVQPKLFMTAQAQWPALARQLGLDLNDMKQLVSQRQEREFVFLKRQISPVLAEQVMALEISGVSLLREYRRYYPLGEVAAHVLGFTNVDDQGQEGMELAYEHWLRGTPGQQRVIKDRLGRVIQHVELLQKPQPGKDLSLSIDRRLQYLTYRELKKAVFEHKARAGSAVILDVHSGEILAMVNQPSYNPNTRRALKAENFRNRAITDVFEPGSTIKPFTIAAGLDSGKFSAESKLNTSPGYLRVGTNVVRDVRNYGQIDVATVLQKSSNVGASMIAMAIPVKALQDLHQALGFGETSASGFPGESTGLVNMSPRWRPIEQATMAFGYGLSVTSLQLARAYSVLGNGGYLKPVHFVRQQQEVEGQRVIQSQTVKAIGKMLEAVVSREGTALKASVQGYRVAGKTGTVKKLVNGQYSEDRYLSLFVGMAPASAPRFVMVVNIDEPKGDVYYGGEVAAPVFSRVMSGALRLFDIAPDMTPPERWHIAASEARL